MSNGGVYRQHGWCCEHRKQACGCRRRWPPPPPHSHGRCMTNLSRGHLLAHLVLISSSSTGAFRESQPFAGSFGSVGDIEEEVAGATAGVLIGGVVGAVELVLDAEVVELVQHVVSVERQVSQLLEELLERRAAYVFALRVVEHPLRVEQLHLEGVHVGSELPAGRPRLHQAVRDGAAGLAHHPPRRAHGGIHRSDARGCASVQDAACKIEKTNH